MRSPPVVKSVRGAVPVFRPARFPGPLPEPAVRLSPQRALRKSQVDLTDLLVQRCFGSSVPVVPPERGRPPDRRYSPTQPPDLPLTSAVDLLDPFAMRESFPPLGLLRVLRPTPSALGRQRTCPPPDWLPGGRATGGWFPRSPLDHSSREVPSYIPVASPRLRRRPSPWPPARTTTTRRR